MAVGTKSASTTMPTILKDDSPQSDSSDSTAATDPVVHGGGDDQDNVVDEALAFVRSLPSGFRFCPQDEELIVCYLRKRVNDEPLPHNLIKDVELYKYDPEHLAEKYREYGEKEWYFFTPRDRKYQNGGRPKRSAGNGYWKATGADKPIKVQGKTVGFRKALVFYHGKPPKGEKTNWIMHEYRLGNLPPRPPPKVHPDGPKSMMLDKCVLCRIYKKDDKPSARSTRQRDGVGTCVGTTSMEDIDVDDDGFVMDSNEVSPVIYPNSTNIISPNSGTTMDVQIPYMTALTPQISPEQFMPPYNYQEFYQPPKPVFLGSNNQNQYVQPVSSFVGHMMPRSRFMPTTEPQPQRFFMSTELAALQQSPPYADDWYQMAETTAGTEFLYDHSDDHQVNCSFYVNPFMYDQKDCMKPSPM